ncbi:hypothetical protein D3C74_308700 [compost metagenome]
MLKKSLATILSLILSLSVLSTTVLAEPETTEEKSKVNGAIMKIDDPVVYLASYSTYEGIYLDDNSTSPISKNGRTYIPASPLIQRLGGTVQWNGADKSITVTLDGNTVILKLNSSIAKINNEAKTVSAAPIIHKGKTMIPIRVVSEAFGLGIEWDSQYQVVMIYRDFFKDAMPSSSEYHDWWVTNDYEYYQDPTTGMEYYHYTESIEVGSVVSFGEVFYGEVLAIKGTKVKVKWIGVSSLVSKGDISSWEKILGVTYDSEQWVKLSDLSLIGNYS